VIPYLHERKQFGQPIGAFQLMQGKLADMYVTMKRRQGLCVCGGAAPATRGRTTREDSGPGAILYAARERAKPAAHPSDANPVPGRQRLYQRLIPPGRLLRDAKLYEIGAGTSEISAAC